MIKNKKLVTAFILFVLTACGGSSDGDSDDDDSDDVVQYEIGGVVNNLKGDLALLLIKDSQNWETVSVSSTSGEGVGFQFSQHFEAGIAYNVEIEAMPQNQECTVSNASGTLANTVNNITVDCVDLVVTETGVFLDSAVENINYQTDTLSGTTNDKGEFEYVAGESVTFSIGDVVLPTVTAKSSITPLDFSSNREITNETVVNVTRLLQSLDQDGDPSNGIKINDLSKSSANTQLNFSLFTEEFEESSDVISLIMNGGQDETITTLIDIHDAIVHLEETLVELSKGETISFPGTWKLTEAYDICKGNLTVHYSTVTLAYDDGTYTFNQDFKGDIQLGETPDGAEEATPIGQCTSKSNSEADENDTFTADKDLTAAEIKVLLADSEVRSVIINSSDQFTVTMRFYTGTDDEYGIDVTQVWKRQ